MKTSPRRLSDSQTAPSLVFGEPGIRVLGQPELPPLLSRHWSVTPWPGVAETCVCWELAAVVSRAMMPAFAHSFVSCCVDRRATALKSPVHVSW